MSLAARTFFRGGDNTESMYDASGTYKYASPRITSLVAATYVSSAPMAGLYNMFRCSAGFGKILLKIDGPSAE